MEGYKNALKIDKQESERYYKFSLQGKSKQQERLECLLRERGLHPATIADIACGGGGMSYHLSKLYPHADYTLVDFNEEAVLLAKQSTPHLKATYVVGDIYNLPLETDRYELVICWQTISWLTQPEIAVRELARICKPGACIFASSLFNTCHDVDVYSTVVDHTRDSAAHGLSYAYNTYSIATLRKWLAGMVSTVAIHEFEIPIDLEYRGRGLGTYTVKLEDGKRLQISAGMLLNWGILELQK